WFTSSYCFLFFFQAEDGIRDDLVTGVQTCALPISYSSFKEFFVISDLSILKYRPFDDGTPSGLPSRKNQACSPQAESDVPVRCQIGRASCRERLSIAEGVRRPEKTRRHSVD